MKIAICSDIHDNLQALSGALADMNDLNAEALVFCGDLNAPFTFKALVEGFAGPVHTVWGNNDGDKWLITELAHQLAGVTLHGEFAEIDFAGYRVAAVHYPRIARALARADLYDLVCYGHDHQQHHERVGSTLLVNPGELMGRFGPPTYVIVDSASGLVQVQKVLPV
ncbi:MAG: YfcE family phosphodiesterase [Anaerolineae bacterium]|nr:YfcE family phosphodiesterase [Anaerolineae bacterium]